MLTKGWRALCDYHRLSHPTPCCPAYPSAQLPPTHTHIQWKDVGMLCDKKLSLFPWHTICSSLHNNVTMTCLKLPFFLCSQSIMSWKIGIIIFRTSVWGTSVTPRKGPIIPGMKWGLLSPGLHTFTQTGAIVLVNVLKMKMHSSLCVWEGWCGVGWSDPPNFCHMLKSS